MKARVAIVRVRGQVNIPKKIKDTFNMLRLYKKNTCVVVPNTKIYIGMIKKIKDYVTWGEINQETLKSLLENRGKLPGKKKLTEPYLKGKLNLTFDEFVKEVMESKKELKDIPGLKLFFKLQPPAKGFDKKGIKTPYSLGGALGYRKEKINELIQRMI